MKYCFFKLVCLHIIGTRTRNFTVNDDGLLKVTSSHVHWKSGNILEMVLDRDVVATGH